MNCRGQMMLALIAMVLFSMAGLGMLGQVVQHSRLERARRTRQLRLSQLQRALTLGLHEYRCRLLAADVASMADPAGELFQPAAFPDREREGCLVHHAFSLVTRLRTERFSSTRVKCRIRADLPDHRFNQSAEVECDLLEGEIPLDRIALQIRRQTPLTAAEFLRQNGIVNRSGETPQVGDVEEHDRLDDFLRKALKLEGETVNWAALRRRLGLEPLDIPIPSGIYVIVDGGRVACLFVQGDLDQFRLDASAGRQFLTLTRGGNSIEASYTPGGADFQAPATEVTGPLEFDQLVLINGAIRSLESGPTAAFASGTRLLVAVAGPVLVTSGLEEEGNGASPHLTLLTRDREFFSRKEVSGDVTISGSGDLVLQTDVIAAGTLVQKSRRAAISGAVHAADVDNRGRLEVGGIRAAGKLDDYLTTAPYRYLDNYAISYPLEDDLD